MLVLQITLTQNLNIQISRPSDLKALCLVSHEVSDLATPVLYRNIFLPYDDTDKEWSKVEALANSKGLRDGHVRSVNIGSCDFTKQSICRPLEKLISKLPHNTLRRFEFGPIARPTHWALQLLWTYQRYLTNLFFDFSLKSPSIFDIIENDLGVIFWLNQVSDLKVNFGHGPPGKGGRAFLNEITSLLPGLRRTSLVFPPCYADSPSPVHSKTSLLSDGLPRTLTHLSLSHARFEIAPLNLPLDQFSALTDLEIHECTNVITLLINFTSPALESFSYRHACGEQESDGRAQTAIIEFLKRLKALKRLTIDCIFCLKANFEDQMISALSAGAASLEYLLITSRGYRDHGFGVQAATKCHNLKQLGFSAGGEGPIQHCEVSQTKSFLCNPAAVG